MTAPSIILVEDNFEQIETFMQALEQYCALRSRPVPKVHVYSSEGSFFEAFQNQIAPADLYIFDLMLRWKEVGERLSIQKPENHHADSAGIRCKDAVQRRFPKVPIIIWTVIEVDHIPSTVFDGVELVRDKLTIERVMRYF